MPPSSHKRLSVLEHPAKRYFSKYENILKDYDIVLKNIYNLDEKGFLFGVGRNRKRIVGSS
jgi:hypothetical protein